MKGFARIVTPAYGAMLAFLGGLASLGSSPHLEQMLRLNVDPRPTREDRRSMPSKSGMRRMLRNYYALSHAILPGPKEHLRWRGWPDGPLHNRVAVTHALR